MNLMKTTLDLVFGVLSSTVKRLSGFCSGTGLPEVLPSRKIDQVFRQADNAFKNKDTVFVRIGHGIAWLDLKLMKAQGRWIAMDGTTPLFHGKHFRDIIDGIWKHYRKEINGL